jgi:hypothetical protein
MQVSIIPFDRPTLLTIFTHHHQILEFPLWTVKIHGNLQKTTMIESDTKILSGMIWRTYNAVYSHFKWSQFKH